MSSLQTSPTQKDDAAGPVRHPPLPMSDVLRELIELERDGFEVAWPDGHNMRSAKRLIEMQPSLSLPICNADEDLASDIVVLPDDGAASCGAAPEDQPVGASSLDMFESHRNRSRSLLVHTDCHEPRAIRRRLNANDAELSRVSIHVEDSLNVKRQSTLHENEPHAIRRKTEEQESKTALRPVGSHASHVLWQHGGIVYCQTCFYRPGKSC